MHAGKPPFPLWTEGMTPVKTLLRLRAVIKHSD